MRKYIPLSVPNFEGNERKYMDDAIEQGWVSTGGAYINSLEQKLEEFLNVDEVAACQSGTSALHLSMVEARIQPGDIVIVSPLTFIAAVNPIRYQFAYPVFIDCDDSFCIDPKKLRDFCEKECDFNGDELSYRLHTVRAIVVVHVFGNMADMVSIMDIATKYHLTVIEDATEALGTKYIDGPYAGKYAGTIGDYGAFSFNGNKIITTGGGGAVTSNSSEKVKHIRYLSTQAKDDVHYYVHNEVGYNYRMTNVQAAIGVAQMEKLQEFIYRKQKNFELYKTLLANNPYCELLDFREGTESNKWFYAIKINRDKISSPLKDIILALEKSGVQTRAIWGLINEQLPYQEYDCYKLNNAKILSDCILNIPCSTQLKNDEIKYVCEQIMFVFEELACE